MRAVQICVELPKWIFAEIDTTQFLYEISRMIRESISALTERPRTNPEKIIKLSLIHI